MLNSGDFREMCKRDMVRVESWAASRMGANAKWNLSGTWEHASLVWRLVEPTMGHNRCREALSAALRLTGFYGEGRDEAAAECFRDRLYVSQFVESLGRDVTRDLLRIPRQVCPAPEGRHRRLPAAPRVRPALHGVEGHRV